ncbi:hypothetical protein ACLQ8Z_03470 [Bordetella hinzii]|uniref:hypothetical protein n=1 Tax=Bordetella hinzii TaxID=103855 RepID=UPI00114DFEBE|nr:hypothetical protein [Bordetella hinzii]QDJ45001.1 hypothetical protein CBR71_03840 [Bordetella hinzii]
MNTVKPVKFEIQRSALASGRILLMVVVTMSNGRSTIWGDPRTERGAKTVLARAARRHGFTVTGDTAQAA